MKFSFKGVGGAEPRVLTIGEFRFFCERGSCSLLIDRRGTESTMHLALFNPAWRAPSQRPCRLAPPDFVAFDAPRAGHVPPRPPRSIAVLEPPVGVAQLGSIGGAL